MSPGCKEVRQAKELGSQGFLGNPRRSFLGNSTREKERESMEIQTQGVVQPRESQRSITWGILEESKSWEFKEVKPKEW